MFLDDLVEFASDQVSGAGGVDHIEVVTDGKAFFEEKGGAQALESTVGENTLSVCEDVGFVHKVGGKEGAARIFRVGEEIPYFASGRK